MTPGLAAAAQPVVTAEDLAPWSAEVVTRILDERGLVCRDTAQAVRAAEEDGSVQRIDGHALDVALGLLRTAAGRFARLQVNVSLVSLLHPGFVDQWRARLRSSGPDAQRLVIELSAPSLVSAARIVHAPVHGLAAAGAGLALDDVTGHHAELELLRDLPIGQVKIDSATVHAATEGDADAAARVQRIVSAAAWRAVPCVAKSVETDEHLALARETQVDLVQGYLVGAPVIVTGPPGRPAPH